MQKIMDKMSTAQDSLVQKFKNRKGFTLIELIVVMAIIGILVLLAAPRFLGYTKDANVTAMQQDAKVLSDASLQYNIVNDTAWPKALEEDGETVKDAVELDEAHPLHGAEAYELDEEGLSDFFKSTKNEVSDYVLITDGDFEGEVFHVNGVDDRDGELQYGTVSFENE